MRWPLWKKIALGYALVTVVILIIIARLYTTFQSVNATTEEVRHIDSVVTVMSDLLSDLKDLETGQRGFVVTGRDEYLQPYSIALSQIGKNQHTLLNIIRLEAVRKQAVQLDPLIRRKISFAQKTIIARRDSGFVAAEKIIASGEGKRIMDSIRVIVADMARTEKSLLEKRIAASRNAFSNMRNFLILSGILSLLIIFLSAYFLIRSINRALEELIKGTEVISTGKLEHQVNIVSNDEIGELARSFNHMAQELETMRGQIREKNIILRTESEKLTQLNHTLEEKNILLEELNAEKNEFLGIAAHDLKNPLSAIKALAEILEKESATLSQDEVKEFAGDIHASSKQMFDLITNLLDVNAIERGGIKLQPEGFDLAYITSHVIDRNITNAQGKNITINFDAPDEEIRGFADISAAKQVIDNVISNAVKYSPHEKSVFVRVRKSPSAAIVEVEDEGPGFTEDDKKKLFSKFSRLSAQPTGGEHSTGLGLSIAKKIIDMMHGKIFVESEAGKGAKFIIEFPLART